MKSAAEAKRLYHASAAGRLIIGPALARLRGDVRGQRVLSIGSGPFELAELRDAGAIERVGVDRSREALAAAAAADPQARTIVADMDALDADLIGVERFDLVQIVMALQFSQRPEVPLRAAFQTLREGGCAVVIVPHSVSWGDDRKELDAAGHHLRMLGYQITAGPDGADKIEVFGSYLKERIVRWRKPGIEFTLRKPSRVHQLIVGAGFTVSEFDEPEPLQNASDAELAAIAEFEGISVETVRMFIERTSNLAHSAAFLAVRSA